MHLLIVPNQSNPFKLKKPFFPFLKKQILKLLGCRVFLVAPYQMHINTVLKVDIH